MRRQKSQPADHIDIVEEITAAQRQQGSAAFARGNAQRAAKDSAGAEQSFRQALALDPALADAAYNLGNLLREAGRAGQAATAYRQALSAKPGHAAAGFNLGLTLSSLGDIEGAAAAYVQTIIHAPHLIQAHVNLTLALRELGRHEEALAASRAALALELSIAPSHCSTRRCCCSMPASQPKPASGWKPSWPAIPITRRRWRCWQACCRATKSAGELPCWIAPMRYALTMPRSPQPF